MKRYLLILFLLASACSRMQTEKISVLSISECDLPCWSSISPGSTSQEEALEILGNLDGADTSGVVLFDQPWKTFSSTIDFSVYLQTPGINRETEGEVYMINKNVIVLSLTRNLNLTFEDGIQRMGEPDAVISMRLFHGGEFSLRAVYPEKGVAFESILYSDAVYSGTEVFNIIFFDSDYYEDLLDIGMFSGGSFASEDTKKLMHPWKGYGSIEELYPPRFP